MPKKLWGIDKEKAKKFQKGFESGGPSMSKMVSNVKGAVAKASDVLFKKKKASDYLK